MVTGSTDGIGKAFAQELASRGMNIIIISLDADGCQRMGIFLGDFTKFDSVHLAVMLNAFSLILC